MIWKKCKKIAGGILTAVIVCQVLLCMVLMLRTASGQDLALFGYRFYYIVSPSMEPVIPVGSQIVVRETDPHTLQEGDIITFVSRDPSIAGLPNTHRIKSIRDENGRLAFVTQGDNNPSEDSYLVYAEDVYGKVVGIAPSWQWLIDFYSFATTPTGFVTCVAMPLLLVLGSFLRSFARTVQEEKREQQRLDDAEQKRIAALVQQYLQEHPGQVLSLEQANAVAGELLKSAAENGMEGTE